MSNKPPYDLRTEALARAALARAAMSGTPEERANVRAAVERYYPQIVSDKTARGHFPNSNMEP